jgi:hypothetical protein
MFQQTRNGLEKKVSEHLDHFTDNCFKAQLLFSDVSGNQGSWRGSHDNLKAKQDAVVSSNLENTMIISSLRHKMTSMEAQGRTHKFTSYVKCEWGRQGYLVKLD